jgi:uncharacterized tellurite resistance protein B-like protein
MIDRLIGLFSGRAPIPAPLPELDAQYALGALLVRVAAADRAYLFEEVSQIDRILALRNGLKPLDAARMRAECERLENVVPETGEFARLIRETVSYDDRRAVARALWQVVLADGVRHEQEIALVDLIEGHLGIHPADSEAVRSSG